MKNSCKPSSKNDPSGSEITLWRFVVLLASFLTMIQLKFHLNCYGIMYSRILMNSNISSTTVAWIFSFSNVCFDTAALFMEPLCNLFGWRKTAFIAGLILGLSTIFSGFFENPWYLFITYSILAGSAMGSLHAISSFIVPIYFRRGRAISVGFLYSGLSLGDFVTPPIVYYLQQCYGERSALFVIGALLFHTCVAAMVFHPVEWHMQQDKPKINSGSCCEETSKTKVGESDFDAVVKTETHFVTNSTAAVPSTSKVRPLTETTGSCAKQSGACVAIGNVLSSTVKNIKLLRQLRVLIITFSASMAVFSQASNFMLLPFALRNKGLQMDTIVWCLSCVGIANAVSRLVVTALADILPFSAKWYFMGGLLSFAGSLIGFGYTKSYTSIILCMVMFGAGVGACGPLVPMIIIEFMGLDHLPKVFGVAGFLQAISFLVIGPIIGLIRDATQDYDMTIQLMSFLLLLAFMSWCLMPMAIAHDGRSAKFVH